MRLLTALMRDENGFVVSAEAALLGTAGVLGSVIGIDLMSKAGNDELRDVAYALRSFDQSYGVAGYGSPTAWTAGSGFAQRPVEESLEELRLEERRLLERENAARTSGVESQDAAGRPGDDAADVSRDLDDEARPKVSGRPASDEPASASADRGLDAFEGRPAWD